MHCIRRWGGPAVVLIGALLLPATAPAAVTKPEVVTGTTGRITTTSARIHGRVNPKGAATTALFQYGTSRLYESRTAEVAVGAGTKFVHVAFDIASLTPAKRYHYRIVARNRKGLTFGKDRTFTTKKQPLAMSLTATPQYVRIGRSTNLTGILSGTGNANRRVRLERNVWPYAGWVPDGNIHLTAASGWFGFPILSVAVNTQYRVVLVANPNTTSPVTVVGTQAKVTRHAKVRRFTRAGRIHFWGRVSPAIDGAQVLIQKVRGDAFRTIKQSTTTHTRKGFSRYSVRVRQRRGGVYRVLIVDTTGKHSISLSRKIVRRHVRR